MELKIKQKIFSRKNYFENKNVLKNAIKSHSTISKMKLTETKQKKSS